MTYIAYAYAGRGRALVQTGEHDTRDAAALELLARFPRLRSASTARAHKGQLTGSDIRFHDRLELARRAAP